MKTFTTHLVSLVVGILIGVGGLILYSKTLESPPPPPEPPYNLSMTGGFENNGVRHFPKLFFTIDESLVINGVTVNEGTCSITHEKEKEKEKVTFPISVVMGTYLTLYTDCQRIVKVVVDTSRGVQRYGFN
jgi:hypothetical protein